ncbi:Transcription initiation factor TFIIIB Brf1 subunit/Transcription initiation factor TFIIB [Paramagnetospirillum magnetotacticum MS-1]|uniref:Transcription initiation factor TFIIIB Brf1 subunit/Transcription initiation factor TFIIB n=1 Tax=Paramagnetospirillum magnetotacticum MS-1 TaxID=272627 RepID=A0A0C2YYW3_PARME|nr:DUF983 domain-containing protein [Paramagnetospirillum magnetotacticum]KIL99860.1 Transcription initiation factor TFIIIB Brf1 subunit/Transcription initiation factor TFIIB [Paramagnetospirillum magnetotacticum MS-1]
MPDRLRVPVCKPAPPPANIPADDGHRRPIALSIWRGLRRRCPRCGVGECLEGYLAIPVACAFCGERLGHIKADDGPAYFTVLIAGHVTVPLILAAEQAWHPPLEVQMVVALGGLGLLIWRLLPRMKGAVLGLMWAHGLKGDEVQGDVERHG